MTKPSRRGRAAAYSFERADAEERATLRSPPRRSYHVELGTYELYLPDDETLATIAVPMRRLVSEDSLSVLADVAGRFGERLGVDVTTTPGSHDAYTEYPDEFAAAMRPFLRKVSELQN